MVEPVSGFGAAALGMGKAMGAAAANEAIKASSKAFVESAKRAIPSLRDHIAAEFLLGFEAYTSRVYNKCKEYKTILNQEYPVSTEESYASLKFSINDETCDDLDLLDLNYLSERKRIVITGLAGSGKSIFMKYLTLCVIRNFSSYVPIFLELRSLNEQGTEDLIDHIMRVCSYGTSVVNRPQFEKSIRSGNVVFILDGYDEVHEEVRDRVQKQILSLESEFPNAVIVVSGRPDNSFNSWTSFYIYKIEPLEKPQCLDLISKFRYDEKIKGNFYSDVNDYLFDQHTSFLSSPLLTTIMLVTYTYIADVPEKIHEFYSNAFDALFEKHDSSKEGVFRRRRRVPLSRQEFKQCFSYFCAQSYVERTYEFSYDKLITYLNKALANFKANFPDRTISSTAEDFAEDIRAAVCLMQVDGLVWTFVHRSFQEYFAAVFATGLPDEKYVKYINLIDGRPMDNAVSMCCDMDQLKYEKIWLLPSLNSRFDPHMDKNPLDLYTSFITSIGIQRHPTRVSFFSNSRDNTFYIHSKYYGGLNIQNMFYKFLIADPQLNNNEEIIDKNIKKHYKGSKLHNFIIRNADNEDGEEDENTFFDIKISEYPNAFDNEKLELSCKTLKSNYQRYKDLLLRSLSERDSLIDEIFN